MCALHVHCVCKMTPFVTHQWRGVGTMTLCRRGSTGSLVPHPLQAQKIIDHKAKKERLNREKELEEKKRRV